MQYPSFQPNHFPVVYSRQLRRMTLSLLVFLLIGLFSNLLEPSPVQAQVAKNFVKAQGDRLTLNGQAITLKGSNFYPLGNSWAYMWLYWDGEKVREGLKQVAEAGNNSVRILIPYNTVYGWTKPEDGSVDPDFLNMLGQFLQAAQEYGLRAIVTLFDFEDLAEAGSVQEKMHRRYAADIVTAFKDDDRIIAWDLHNEPDHYGQWENNREKALTWLSRMRGYVKQLDSNHLITIGMGKRENHYATSSEGFSVLDLVDFVSHHSYNADALNEELYELQERTGRQKPIILEETGWPSGPIFAPDFTEEIQTAKYRQTLESAKVHNISGVFQWAFFDIEPVGLPPWEDINNYYGLIRRNGTAKPAYEIWRANYTAPKLPAAGTTSNLAYTLYKTRPKTGNYFPQSDHYIGTPLYEMWRRTGGANMWGFPLTDAFLKEDVPGGRHNFENDFDKTPIYQYFEKGRFEYHRERRGTPEFERLKDTPLDKYFYLIDRGKLGLELANARGYKFGSAVRLNRPDDATYQWFTQTNHSLQEPFLSYWRGNWGNIIFGSPISEPFEETNPETGQRRLVQYFENGRLEFRPEFTNTRHAIEVGNVGTEYVRLLGWLKNPAPANVALTPQTVQNSEGSATASGFGHPAFEKVWQRSDSPVQNGAASRSWLWGEKPGTILQEPYKEAPGGFRLVQYFDKTRMELTNPQGDQNSKYFVSNGLLVREMIEGQVQLGDNLFEANVPADVPVAGDPAELNSLAPTYASLKSALVAQPNRVGQAANEQLAKNGEIGKAAANLSGLAKVAAFIPETGHNIPDVLWDFLTKTRRPLIENGQTVTGDVVDWLFSTGYPLTEAYWIKAKVGGVEKDILLQAFERRVLTYTPTNPPAYRVEMGNVGLHYQSWRYPQGQLNSGEQTVLPVELKQAGALAFREVAANGAFYRYAPQLDQTANAATLAGSVNGAGRPQNGPGLVYLAPETAGRLAIHLNNLNGNNRVAAYGFGAALTTDSTKLAFVSYIKPEMLGLFVQNAAGSTPQLVASDVLTGLAWSADGRKLAFYLKESNRLTVAITENGGAAKTLHTTPADTLAGTPVFSPDGNWLVYTLFHLTPDERGPKIGAAEIRGINLTSGEEKLLAENGGQPVFSPDGKHLAYLGWQANALWQMDWNNGPGASRKIANALGCSYECANVGRPAYSANGNWLAFGGLNQNLVAISSAGGTTYRLTAPGTPVFDPVWK